MNNIKEVDLLRMMVRIRCFEEKVSELKNQGKIQGPVHTCIGQEAVSVGICSALREDDFIIGNHRSHGHQIAKGANINLLMAEVLGKESGTNKGRGGSMHVSDKTVGGLLTTAIVGSGLSVACGSAFASTYFNDDKITCVFFGDGAVNEGVFHESLTLASLWNLPVLFVLENNNVAVTTVNSHLNAWQKARGYGVASFKVDGQRVEDVYDVAKRTIDKIRRIGTPSFIEAVTHRFHEHQEGKAYDKMRGTGYRNEVDENRYRENFDPIKLYTTGQDIEFIYTQERQNIENTLKYAEL